jgi:branched-subunit amino acid aminotransferase/4-amino-4-deoxychorismate lyase
VAGNVPPPLRVQLIPYLREMPQVKHISLFGAVRTRRDAQLAGFDDVIFTDHKGNVLEGATWNIGFIDVTGGVLWPAGEFLAGVTMELLKSLGYNRSGVIGLPDLSSMQAAFATNTSVGVRPIIAVGDIQWPAEHPMLELLRKHYADIPTDAV